MTKVYAGDTGTVIVLDCGQDISAASARSIEARKPDGSTVTWSASANGTTAIQFTTQSGSLDMPGRWKLQAKVTLPSGQWRGETAALDVYSPFGLTRIGVRPGARSCSTKSAAAPTGP